MLDKLFHFADASAALAAFAIILVAFIVYGVIDPRNKTPEMLKDPDTGKEVPHLKVGAPTPTLNIAGFKNMLGVYEKHQAYADAEKQRVYEKNQEYADAERWALIYDYFLLVIYGIAGAFILAYLLPFIFPGSFERFRFLALLPVFAAFFDAVENTTMYFCLGRDPDEWSSVLVTSRVATMLKWILIAAGSALFLFGLAKLVWLLATGKLKAARA